MTAEETLYMQALWTAEEEVRALKIRILADLREIAAYDRHAPIDSEITKKQ